MNGDTKIPDGWNWTIESNFPEVHAQFGKYMCSVAAPDYRQPADGSFDCSSGK